MILTVKELPGLFSTVELEEIERNRPEGISSQETISLFQARGVKLSEATFRKYVQLGLLPTSRRVGQKGKHRGSRGIYSISVIRRINLIKSMMQQDMTLEEIRDSFLAVQIEMEKTQEAMQGLFASLQERIQRLELRGEATGGLLKELEQAHRNAQGLITKLEKISSRLAVIGSPSSREEQGGLP
jgi:DNA-binding transcriptional MerR regulator